MTQHTQTKLAHRYGRIFSADREALTIANVGRAADGDFSEANARRLVACWNLCEGIETEKLEQIPPAVLLVHGVQWEQYLALKAERDELLAALRVAEESVGDINALEIVRAALSKHQPAGEGPTTMT